MPVLVQKAVRGDEIPSDAIRISRDEALEKQWDMIQNWKSWTEVFPLRRGSGLVSGVTVISTMMLTNHYRGRLKLRSFGMVPMYLPTVFMPSICSALFHRFFVTNAILLQSECPVCIHGRSVLSQLFFGFAYPLFLAPVGACYYAMAKGTYDVPPLQPRYISELARLWLDMTKRLKLKIPILIAANILAPTLMTYLEEDCFFKLQRKLYEQEQTLSNELTNDK